MRRTLLAASLAIAVGAGGSLLPVTGAGAASTGDPDAATVGVRGTLLTAHGELGADQHVLALSGGGFVPLTFGSTAAAPIAESTEAPRPFAGHLVVPDALADRLDLDDGDTVSAASSDGKAVLKAASTSGTPLAVQAATIGSAPESDNTAAASSSDVTTHRLYVAEITNVGTLPSTTELTRETDAIRNYWTNEANGAISSFDQPTSAVRYTSAVATTSNGCGLGNAGPTWTEAAKKFPGVDFNARGNHLMVLVPRSCSGSYGAGIGTVGDALSSGGLTIVVTGDIGVQVGAHEIGHNLSLQHANAFRCASCQPDGYRDIYSIMGLAVSGNASWTPPALDTSYRRQLGIPDDTSTVTGSGTLRLSARGSSAGTRGAIVTDPSSKRTYTVEYRSGTGRDASAFYADSGRVGDYDYRPGVVVERLESDGQTTMMTQPNGSRFLTSYLAGQRFATGTLSVTVESASAAAGALVRIELGQPSTPTSNPASGPATFAPGTPRVLGTPRVGSRLRVTPGEWSPSPGSFSVHWSVDGRPVARTNSWWFTPGPGSYGKRISATVTGYRSGYTTVSRTTSETSPVAAGRFSSRKVRVSGHAKVGRTLIARTPTWRPAPQLTYRWYANGHVIVRAHGRTLHVTARLAGKRIAVRVTARQHGYRTTSRLSARTGSVR